MTMLEAKVIVTSALILAGLGPSVAWAGPSGSFGDWAVTCTDGLTCSASVFREGSGTISSLSVDRPVDPKDPPSIVIGLNRTAKLGGDVTFSVDGGDPIRIPATRLRPEETRYALGEGDGGKAIIDAMRDGRTIRVGIETADGPQTAEFSLKGLAASLRFADEAQRRDGTKAAFVALGDKPAPDAATLPKDIAKRGELPAAIARLWQAEGCGDVDEANIGTLGFSTPITEGRLFGLICGQPGAYNVDYAMFAELGDEAFAVPFPGMSAKGPVAAFTAMNIDWDDRAKQLESFAKYRGLGDCGLWQRWTLSSEEGAGVTLLLAESREKEGCDGSAEDVDQWPRLWPTGK